MARAIKKAAHTPTKTELILDEELAASTIEYNQVLREAKKRNKLMEAQRRITNIKDEFDDDEDDDEEEQDDPLMNALFSQILGAIIPKKNTDTAGEPTIDYTTAATTKQPHELDNFVNRLSDEEKELYLKTLKNKGIIP